MNEIQEDRFPGFGEVKGKEKPVVPSFYIYPQAFLVVCTPRGTWPGYVAGPFGLEVKEAKGKVGRFAACIAQEEVRWHRDQWDRRFPAGSVVGTYRRNLHTTPFVREVQPSRPCKDPLLRRSKISTTP